MHLFLPLKFELEVNI